MYQGQETQVDSIIGTPWADVSVAPRRAGAASAWMLKAARELATALTEHRLFLGGACAYILMGYLIEAMFRVEGMMDLSLWSGTLVMVALGFSAAFLGVHAIRMLYRHRHTPSLRAVFKAAWDDLRQRYLYPQRVLGFLIVLAALPPFMSAFGSFKHAIPVFHPFNWDPTLMDWDRALHGGLHPWEWLQPLLGHPWVSSAISHLYCLWFILLGTVLVWQAWSSDRRLRTQFFLTFILTWSLIGTAMAMALSSAGPCYYGRITGQADPYAPLMQYLGHAHESSPVWALQLQELLWEGYRANGVNMVKGITAMPSMHVSSVVLFALVGWRANRRLGIALTAFALIVMVGSVHLGWHYALDGYVAALVTAAVWKAVGFGLRRSQPANS